MTPVPPPAPGPQLKPLPPEEKTDPNANVTIGEMRHSQRVTRWVFGIIGAIVTSGAGAGGVVAALSLVRTEARAQAREEVREQMKAVDRIDAGQKGLEARVSANEQQTGQLRAEVYDARVEQKEYARGLQEVILTNRPSPKLNKPLPPPPPAPPRPDGGPP